MPTTVVHGQPIHYVDVPGEEPALLLVHSSGLDQRQWGALRLSLRDRRRILAPDLLGYGKNASWDAGAPFTLKDDIDVVDAVLEHAGSPVVLVGHSYGGFLALSVAIRRPERVAAILVHEPVVWGVFYGIGDSEKIAAVERVNEDGRFLSSEHGGLEPWWRRFIEVWAGEGAWDALPQERRDSFLSVGPKVFEEVRALCLDRTPPEEWAALSVPLVITVGAGTQPLEADACRIVASAVPGARLVDLPGGHMAPLTAPDAFATVLEELIERLPQS